MPGTGTDTAPTPVDFWFDPLCPWTWMTSRWLLEVAEQRELAVNWRVMSLAILNQDKLDQVPEEYHELLGPKGWRPIRVLSAARALGGNDAVAALYTALGAQFHRDGQGPTLEAIGIALEQAGLPAKLAEEADASTYDDEIRASHQAAQDGVGEEAGSPVLAVPNAEGGRTAFFGPIASPIPRGAEALRLWDATLLLASVPGAAELKRSRSAGPSFE
ncbi:mycothiol-dependent nitroreductase Rv2466c family protein [Streptomyces sp. NBC_01304]|uniref:mycothiol-dependent nitroreductase Rv2466c family protein n=1 Tax=Streptomyces sp. NBC_01304 TaxID=2903818 RepID=UPI002E0F9EA8|nr:disulfide bond formation protein DsbA [Streptomyces sp. NBC_01304]